MTANDAWYGWGNPGVNTFKKKFIRTVKACGTTVQVHAFIADLVSEVIESAATRGVQIPEEIQGWTPGALGTGFELFPGLSGEDYERWQFVAHDGSVVFEGSATEAKKLSKQAESERVLRSVNNEPLGLVWETRPPGCREVVLGDRGNDVLFFQMYVGMNNQEGVCIEETLAYGKQWQKRNGTPVTDSLDDSVWNSILPTTLNFQVEYGSSGLVVRALQCLLVAYDWAPEDMVVTGRFDQVTYAAVKSLQDTYGIRSSGACDLPEWAVLLGHPVRHVG